MNKVEEAKFEKVKSWLSKEFLEAERNIKKAAKEGRKDDEKYLNGYSKGVFVAINKLVESGLWKE